MILDNSEWFLLGASCILFLYFITYYLTRRSERYNLYFAAGCLISIIRTVSYNLIDVIDKSSIYSTLNIRIDYLSFIWGPFLYILLADSLFPRIGRKTVLRIFLIADTVLSAFIIFVPIAVFPYYVVFDYIIFACILYASYIITAALIKKRQYAIPVFIANLIFIAGVIYDVLRGSNIISGPFGEMFGYTYLVYLLIVAVVSAQKHMLVDKKRLESQINFLHAQIQPHFLYNTINTIIAYSRTDPEQSRQLLIELSTYLRGKFKGEKDMFTLLKDEIDLIKAYLSIEQVRFKDRLSVEYDIDEDCNILIPCLILQPIVENAVKHGLIPKKEGGKLKLSVKKEEETVVVRIKDNGIGMDMNKLPDILEGRQPGIGITNTNERLKRYYNTQIKATSKPGAGTEFVVTIPVSRGKKT